MHRTARTAPGTGSVRPRVAVLAAVVLVLLAALGIAGPLPGATGEPVAGAVAGASRHGDTEPRADDGRDTVCAVRAATRQEQHSERPAPRGLLATCAPGTDVTPPGAARLPAPAAHTPSSGPHTLHDRGRAPPATSGI
ncbi:hypothetical protein PV963_03105 [Streptomyces coeruleorubidus]|uniref:hypothetical protein n=1 Tax=Streptomyces coeruleorubidus TaxID=116188 RepID=UPI00237F437A|nr:hypothetical protein [Streptomyces coeruleorubidus]WDV49447.1 hypothetical protein PV963_03105 [Streptomyces coeruleorubidus]